MYTLTQYLTRTKGIEYLLAILLLVAFYIVWQLLHHREKPLGLALRVLPAAVFMLIAGGLGFISVRSSQSESRQSPDTVDAAPGAELPVHSYHPAWLNHTLHVKRVGDCQTCHHYSGSVVQQCRTCHETSPDPNDLNKPGLARIYHIRCIGCHTEQQQGPTECSGCHKGAAEPPVGIPHALDRMQNCLLCHGSKGVAGVVRIPPDHARTAGTVCLLCHQPLPAPSVKETPRITHEKDRPGCLMCHGNVRGHAGRTGESCLLCHQAQGE